MLAVLAAPVTQSSAQQPAQQPASPQKYEPQRGQPGKDVMWIGTPDRFVDLMLNTAQVTKDDTVIDLGSGDGRLVIAAAKRGARAVGIEFNPKMVDFAKDLAAKEGVAATFIRGDIFETDFSYASVLTLFLLDELNEQLRPKILDMKPGTRVVSNTFRMGEWEPDVNIGTPDQKCGAYCNGYFWIVPAKAAGAYRMQDGTLTLQQTFQMLSGTLVSGGTERAVSGKLAGTSVTLDIGGEAFTGEVSGDRVTLASKDGARRLTGQK